MKDWAVSDKRLQAIFEGVVARLESAGLVGSDREVVAHTISNGGLNSFRALNLALESRGQSIKWSAIIIEAAPSLPIPESLARFLMGMWKLNGHLWLFLLTLLCWFILLPQFSLFQFSKGRFGKSRLHLIHEFIAPENLQFPRLYLYTNADKVVPAYHIVRHVNRVMQSGIKISAKSWDNAPHAGILQKDYQGYSQAIRSFLDGKESEHRKKSS